MTEVLSGLFVPLLFGGLMLFLLTGFPVAFGLAATGLTFGLLGMQLGLFPSILFNALPLRVFGIVQNETLLALPFFTLMGMLLQRSGIAEELLETIGQVFGPMRGGLAFAVIFVGGLLAATTGVVSAAVISMGLISLPVMMRYGYNRTIATGVIMASGVLAQIIPPSTVLIVLADQLGRSVGDMYLGALVPGLLLVLIYSVFIAVVAVVRPKWVPALPPHARIYHETDGASGHLSLVVVVVIGAVSALAWAQAHEAIMNRLLDREGRAPFDELIVLSLTVSALVILMTALANRWLRLGLLSRLCERATLLLIPPLVLIFLVLGTIFIGVATPTEAGAMGAVGALAMAIARRRLSYSALREAIDSTAQLTCFVMFILIGATVFSFTFNAADGHIWVERLFGYLPGGQLGFVITVSVLVFVLGCFLDFFEICFIVVPILAPVAEKMGVDLIWFGVLIAMNLQTSYLTPPFGFALFFLRSVAARRDYSDPVTGERISAVTTQQIYGGSVYFVALQLLMVVILIAYPGLVTDRLDRPTGGDVKQILIQPERGTYRDREDDPMQRFGPQPAKPRDGDAGEVDPMERMRRALERDRNK
jgi:TRAP-type mannitol/chloroaromatic compound transport system permease large subunit